MIFDEDNDKPRYRKIIEEADIALLSSSVATTFPYSMKEFVKEQTKAKLRSNKYAAAYGIDIKDFGTEDAIFYQYNGMDMIIYNDSINSKQRKRFSLGHETGHIKLDHDLNNKESYGLYEVEANFYAAQILMPEQIINELIKRGKDITIKNLMAWFDVSEAAARKRLETLNKIDFSRRNYDERNSDKQVILKYKKFIDSVAPLKTYYYDPYEDEEEQRERDKWL